MQIQLLLSHGTHGDKVWIDDGDLHDTVEAIDPKVALLGRRAKEHETASVCLQLETVHPRRLLTINVSLHLDALDANDLTPSRKKSNESVSQSAHIGTLMLSSNSDQIRAFTLF